MRKLYMKTLYNTSGHDSTIKELFLDNNPSYEMSSFEEELFDSYLDKSNDSGFVIIPDAKVLFENISDKRFPDYMFIKLLQSKSKQETDSLCKKSHGRNIKDFLKRYLYPLLHIFSTIKLDGKDTKA
jgi:hypothetical protein